MSQSSPLSSGSSQNEFRELNETFDCPGRGCDGFLAIFYRVSDPTRTPSHVCCSNKRNNEIGSRCFTKTIFSKHADGICIACGESIRHRSLISLNPKDRWVHAGCMSSNTGKLLYQIILWKYIKLYILYRYRIRLLPTMQATNCIGV